MIISDSPVLQQERPGTLGIASPVRPPNSGPGVAVANEGVLAAPGEATRRSMVGKSPAPAATLW